MMNNTFEHVVIDELEPDSYEAFMACLRGPRAIVNAPGGSDMLPAAPRSADLGLDEMPF